MKEKLFEESQEAMKILTIISAVSTMCVIQLKKNGPR